MTPIWVITATTAIRQSRCHSPSQLYDQTFTSVNVSSNGRLDFVVPNEPGGYHYKLSARATKHRAV